MKYSPEKVSSRYDEISGTEDRMEKEKCSLRTEIPREFIRKCLKKSDVALDAGGGAGINAIMMARKCRHVTLVDLSRKVLQYAKKNVKGVGLEKKIDLFEGDISDLSRFGSGQFGFVLCVGDSISYVLEKRFKAMAELARVAKKGAIMIIGCDSKYGVMRKCLQRGNLKEAIRINRMHETDCRMGPRTHVYSIDEMEKLLEKNGCKVLEIASTPSISDVIIERYTDRIDKNFRLNADWKELKKLEMEICTRPELQGIGSHLLFIARKK